MKPYIIVFLFIISGLPDQQVSAQDSLKIKADTTARIDSAKEKVHSPLFAGIASAVIPGAGQVYNKKYWKVPIVYAALGTAAYFAYYNANIYFTVHENLNSRVDSSAVPSPQYLVLNNIFSKTTIDLNAYSYDELIQVEDDYRRYFTISLIVGTAIYILNILDAVVDAHLYHFDISDDLSLNVRPEMLYASSYKPAPGLALSLTLK